MAYRQLHITGSTMIEQIEYDVEARGMRVTFRSGAAYEATGVDPVIASALEQPGASAGNIWHSMLKAPHHTWSPV